MQKTRGKGHSLLIVDDEEGLRYGLEQLFKRHGFTVYAVGDGQRARTIAGDSSTITGATSVFSNRPVACSSHRSRSSEDRSRLATLKE